METRPHNKTRVAEYLAAIKEPCIGIFDIGTRAARLLVAPKVVPISWGQDTFCTVSEPFSLGEDVNLATDTLPLTSKKLQFLIGWIRSQRENAENHGVGEVTAIGTAVFRWLENRDEVLQKIFTDTGVQIEVVPEYKEAELTLLSVPEICARRGGAPSISDDDTIMVLDQGGGSLEISWMRWGDRTRPDPTVQMRLFDELGTVALRQLFFETSATGQAVRPDENRAGIAQQMRRIQDHAQRVIAGWRGGPKAASLKGGKLHVFALGSAVTESVGGNSYGKQYKTLDASKMDEVVENQRRKLESSTEGQQVMTLHKSISALTDGNMRSLRKRYEMDDDFAILYGLPVYRRVLEKCKVDSLSVWGYGLRHGFYLRKYLSLHVNCSVEPDIMLLSAIVTPISQSYSMRLSA